MKAKDFFTDVYNMVSDGLGIAEACEELGISRGSFYSQITQSQKLALAQARTSRKLVSIKGNGGHEYYKYRELHEFFTTKY